MGGGKEECPFKACTGWLGSGARNQSPKCLVDFSRSWLHLFLEDEAKKKKKKDMKLECEHNRVKPKARLPQVPAKSPSVPKAGRSCKQNG